MSVCSCFPTLREKFNSYHSAHMEPKALLIDPLGSFWDVICIFKWPLASSVYRSQGKYRERAEEGLLLWNAWTWIRIYGFLYVSSLLKKMGSTVQTGSPKSFYNHAAMKGTKGWQGTVTTGVEMPPRASLSLAALNCNRSDGSIAIAHAFPIDYPMLIICVFNSS